MKKPLIIALVTTGMFITACSGDNNESKTENTTDAPEQEQTNDPEPQKTIALEDIDSTKMKVVEVVDDKGNVVQVAKNTETGEEIMIDTTPPDEKVEKGSETSDENIDQSQETTPDFNIHEYAKLNAFLGKYVTSDGHVKYSTIKTNKSELDAIIAEFKSTTPESSWSKNQKLAFWINAYNIYTIKLIVDNYPTTSITKITAKPWDKKFANIGGKTYTLNNIETDIIRKQFKEPRIHFALNCASKSCPILLNKAYKAGSLDSQLTSQTKKFLSDTSKNTFSKKEAQISQIFDWYKEDFGSSVIDFIQKYHTLEDTPKKIGYMEYSWDLNK